MMFVYHHGHIWYSCKGAKTSHFQYPTQQETTKMVFQQKHSQNANWIPNSYHQYIEQEN